MSATESCSTISAARRIPEALEELALQEFPKHPFDELSRELLDVLLPQYLVMSAAFPFLQSGAAHRLVMDAIDRRRPMTPDVEITTTVATFLVWDEIGAWGKTRSQGAAALPDIVDTGRFHSHILAEDLRRLYGREIDAVPCQPTVRYLESLSDGLSSVDPVRRVAMMVSFELHATRMISALWDGLAKHVSTAKECLRYFSMHVGGADPAEIHHVAMTKKMIDACVTDDERGRFRREFVACYGLHVEWCAQISQVGESTWHIA